MRAYKHEYLNGWFAVLFRDMSRETGWCWIVYSSEGKFQTQGKSDRFDNAISDALEKAAVYTELVEALR